MARKTVSRYTVTVTSDGDPTEQSRRVSDFLFERCPGNVAELAVVDFLRRLADQHGRFPWTNHGGLPEIKRATEAVMRPPSTRRNP